MKNFGYMLFEVRNLYNFKKKFSGRIIALQCCVGFCHTTWISQKCTYGPFLLYVPPTPHPIPFLSVVIEHPVEIPVFYGNFRLAICLTYGSIRETCITLYAVIIRTFSYRVIWVTEWILIWIQSKSVHRRPQHLR